MDIDTNVPRCPAMILVKIWVKPNLGSGTPIYGRINKGVTEADGRGDMPVTTGVRVC